MIVSKIDGTVCKNDLGLSIHLKKHSLTILEYYLKYENFKVPKCTECDLEARIVNGIRYRSTCGSKQCLASMWSKVQQNWSEESREKIRQARLRYLSDPANFSKTAWGKTVANKMTYGEEKLHTAFTESKIYERFDVAYQYVVYPYCIDFAFVNEKIAVEFDGKCHFKYEKRIAHDIRRDQILSEKGWRVYRISYLEIESFKVSDLLEFIGDESIEKKRVGELLTYRDIKPKVVPFKRKQNELKYINTQLTFIEVIKRSSIDFTKFGWVDDVGLIINQKPQKVNGWMKRFMSEFYELECFKRKTTK